MFSDIYRNRKVLVTGHTGFKGGWLSLWLKELGAEVCGYSLEPNTEPSLFTELKLDNRLKSVIGDIRDRQKLESTFDSFRPEIVFHLAAQPLVRLSYSEPVLTYETNVIGTLNVLEVSRRCSSVKAFVNITTDKCYENREVDYGYQEDDPMGGFDIYSSSKGCAELLSSSYRRSFLDEGYQLATARAGNVIGGGDWAQDRLLPDCVRAINRDEKIEIRNPLAVRPWQHVLEPLSAYLLLGEKLMTDGREYAGAFNFGPHEDSVLTVADVATAFIKYYGKGEIVVHEKNDLHEAKLLMLNVNKAEKVLGWRPLLHANEAIRATAEWYKRFYNGDDLFKFTINQINDYAERL